MLKKSKKQNEKKNERKESSRYLNVVDTTKRTNETKGDSKPNEKGYERNPVEEWR